MGIIIIKAQVDHEETTVNLKKSKKSLKYRVIVKMKRIFDLI